MRGRRASSLTSSAKQTGALQGGVEGDGAEMTVKGCGAEAWVMADGCMHDAMRGRRMLTSLARQPGALQGEGGDMAVKRCGAQAQVHDGGLVRHALAKWEQHKWAQGMAYTGMELAPGDKFKCTGMAVSCPVHTVHGDHARGTQGPGRANDCFLGFDMGRCGGAAPAK